MRNRLSIRGGEPLAVLLPELVRPGGVWRDSGLAPERTLLPVLAKLVELGDERAVPCLVALLGADAAPIRRAAAIAVDKLMPRDPAGLVLLETTIRDRGEYAYDAWWPSDRIGMRPPQRGQVSTSMPKVRLSSSAQPPVARALARQPRTL